MPTKTIKANAVGQNGAVVYSWSLDYLNGSTAPSGVSLTTANSFQNTLNFPDAFNFYSGNGGDYKYDINVIAEDGSVLGCNDTKSITVSLSCKLTDIQISNPSQSGSFAAGYTYSWNGIVSGSPSNISYSWSIYPAPVGFTVLTNGSDYSITLQNGYAYSNVFVNTAIKYSLTLIGKDTADNNSGNTCMQTDTIDFYIIPPQVCSLQIATITII
jgi:hypothetical protein